MNISTGVMSADLWEWDHSTDFDATVDKYIEAIRANIITAYPYASLSIPRQDYITGATPYTLKTHVDLTEHEERSGINADAVEQHVDDIISRVWENSESWVVSKEHIDGE
jgi:hypothetical protein